MAGEQRDVTVLVPRELADACVGLVQAFAEMLKLEKLISDEEDKAKSVGALLGVKACREVRAAWRGAFAPLLQAFEVATGQKFPPGPDVGRLSREQAKLVDPFMMGGSFVTIGEGAAAKLVAKFGLGRAAKLVGSVGTRSGVALKGAMQVVKRVAARGALPALATAGFAAGFTNCAKLVGLAIGLRLALPLAEPALKSPVVIVGLAFAALWLLSNNRR